MVWKKAKRFLAGLCTVAMLTQSVFDSTIFVAAAGSTPEAAVETSVEAAVSGGEAVVAADAVSDSDAAVDADADDVSSADAAMAQDDAADVSGDSVKTSDATGADAAGAEDVSASDAEETPVPQVAEVPENVGYGYWLEDGATLKLTIGDTTYATLDENGVLTIGKGVELAIGPDMLFPDWDINPASYKTKEEKAVAEAKLAAAKAFKAKVKSVKFEEGSIAKGIAEKTFSECVNLTSVDLTNDSKLTLIDPNAFEKCTSLTDITFNQELQFIRKSAFTGCTALKHVTFTPSLIRLEESAFSGCTSLETIRIEASNMACKTNSGGDASNIFKDCKLKSFELAAKAAEASESGNNIIIPANLFNGAGFDQSATLVIPYDIQEIGAGAFKNSTLVAVEFQNSAEHPSAMSVIGKEAFYGCTKLTDVTFHTTLQSIGESAFMNCTTLQKVVIPNSVNSLGKQAFKGCSGINSLTLSNGTTEADSIGDYAFQGCVALTAVSIPSGTYVGNYEFSTCTKLASVTIPSSISEIGKYAFERTALVQVKLPNEITEVKEGTFNECTKLMQAVLPEGVTKVGNKAFYKCQSLTWSDFPTTLTEIGDSAYYFCAQFTDIYLSENLEKIGSNAFKECQNTNKVVLQSQKLTTCGSGIFTGCWIREIVFPVGITTIPGNLFNQASFTTGVTVTIPATVTTIGKGAFGGSKSAEVNVTKFVFEEGTQISVIGDGAFSYCTAITGFTIPDTVTEIGASAFEGCNKLESIIIPENVTKIGAGAFKSCSILSNIVFNAIAVTSSNENIFAACNVKTITIGPKVTIFPAKLFKGAQFSVNQNTEEVEYINITIPAAVEEIGEYALPSITNLQQVIFADGSQLKKVGQYAFYQCSNMTVCNIPDSVESIGNNAFAGCTVLGSDASKPFKLPSSLTTLGTAAFKDCSAITAADIGAYVKEIPNQAFMNDSGMKSTTFAGVLLTKIGESAYENCSGLTTLDIPNSVTTIGKNAFKGCTGLNKVVIPSSVTSIGADAFAGCDFAQFYVVPGSYAEKWLSDNGLLDKAKLLIRINYELDGGKNNIENPSGYEAGETFTFKPATKDGYTFKGWYKDAGFTQEIAGVEGCTEELTIYAKWEIITYNITYVLGDDATNNSANPATYTVETATISLQNPTRLGFKFEGWFTNLEDTKTKVTQIRKGSFGDITLYAKWTGNNAEAPTASIASGTFVKAGTKVKLSTTAAGVNIYYTTDGSTPTTGSTLYAGGITITQNVTIKAIAAGVGYLPSEVATFTYYLMDETQDWGDVASEDRGQFADASKVPTGIWVAGVKDADYTGAAITFDLRVYDNKTLLTEGTDYTVKYANNKLAADKSIGKKAPKVTIKAKGNYSGSAEVTFTIKAIDITNNPKYGADDLSVNATGKAQTKLTPVLWEGTRKMKAKKEYTVSFWDAENKSEIAAPAAAGTYTIRLTGTGNYTGYQKITLTIASTTSLAKAKVSGYEKKMAYTGSAITQKPVVAVGGATLTEGTDYTIAYRNNVDAGTATMTINGMGAYCGSKQVTFKITGVAKISKAAFTYNTSVVYTGSAIEASALQIKGSYNGQTLTEGKDFTCSYLKNKDAGTGTIVITGKGGFEGTVKKSFKITAADISKLTLKFIDETGKEVDNGSYAYEKGGTKPAIAVYFGTRKLVSGKDYTVSYSGNTKAGAATVSVKGKKNFGGTLSGKFTVTKSDISNLVIIGSDLQFTKEEGAINNATVTVKDVNDKLLVLDEDYTVKYVYQVDTTLADGKTVKKAGTAISEKDILPAGTFIQIQVTGKGNYEKTGYATMRVIKSSIAKAKVKVNAQTYTGTAIEPGMDQLTVTIGKVTLDANDFEIVDYSNNVKKGTAKLTIRGKNNYGGVKTVTFKITQKKFEISSVLNSLFGL